MLHNQERFLLWAPASSCTPTCPEGRVVSGLGSYHFFSASEVLPLNSCAFLYSRVPGVLVIESNRRKGRSLISWHPWVFLWLSPGDGFPIPCLSPSVHIRGTQGYIFLHTTVTCSRMNPQALSPYGARLSTSPSLWKTHYYKFPLITK